MAIMPPPRCASLGPNTCKGPLRTPQTTATEHKPSEYAGDEPGRLRPGTSGAGISSRKQSGAVDDTEDATARSEVQLLSALSSMKVRQEAAKLDLFIEEDATEPVGPQESNVVRVETHGHGAYASQLHGMASFLEDRAGVAGKLDLLAMMDDETQG